MLVRVQDVAPVLKDEIGYGGNQAFLVRAANQQNAGILHEMCLQCA